MQKGPLLRCKPTNEDKAFKKIIQKNLDMITCLNEFDTAYIEGFLSHMEEEKLAEVRAQKEMFRNLAQVEAVAEEVDLEVLLSNGDEKHHPQTPVLAHVQEHVEFCEAHTYKSNF